MSSWVDLDKHFIFVKLSFLIAGLRQPWHPAHGVWWVLVIVDTPLDSCPPKSVSLYDPLTLNMNGTCGLLPASRIW
jgi:hypothetical protein